MDDSMTEDEDPGYSLKDFCLDYAAEGRRFIDVYADDVIIKYLIRPMALHPLETLAVTLIVFIGFPFLCGSLSSDDVCDRQYKDLFLFTYLFLGFLMLYMAYLKRVRPRRGLRRMSLELMV